MKSIQADVLPRIEEALRAAAEVLNSFANNVVNVQFKKGDDPVTEADTKADQVLRKLLLRDDEGWLSEETADTLERLNKRDVWVVDPLDGTHEFVAGIAEWAVAAGVALVLSGGGTAYGLHRVPAVFNSKSPKLTGLIAHSKGLTSAVARTLGFHLSASNSVQK